MLKATVASTPTLVVPSFCWSCEAGSPSPKKERRREETVPHESGHWATEFAAMAMNFVESWQGFRTVDSGEDAHLGRRPQSDALIAVLAQSAETAVGTAAGLNCERRLNHLAKGGEANSQPCRVR